MLVNLPRLHLLNHTGIKVKYQLSFTVYVSISYGVLTTSTITFNMGQTTWPKIPGIPNTWNWNYIFSHSYAVTQKYELKETV